MTDAVGPLVLDLLEWIGDTPRPYSEVLDAWRTSCPRLPVWEEANDHGFVVRQRGPDRTEVIAVSAAGRRHLEARRPVRRAS